LIAALQHRVLPERLSFAVDRCKPAPEIGERLATCACQFLRSHAVAAHAFDLGIEHCLSLLHIRTRGQCEQEPRQTGVEAALDVAVRGNCQLLLFHQHTMQARSVAVGENARQQLQRRLSGIGA
jgi:hypothetical protein